MELCLDECLGELDDGYSSTENGDAKSFGLCKAEGDCCSFAGATARDDDVYLLRRVLEELVK